MDSSRRNRKFENRNHSRRYILRTVTTLAVALALGWAAPIQTAQAQQRPATPSARPPNILVIWGDDIGTWNISHNNRGMMGYQTPTANVPVEPVVTVSP